MGTDRSKKEEINELANTSRNKRQASLLLTVVARQRSEDAARKCAESDQLLQQSEEICKKSKKLRKAS